MKKFLIIVAVVLALAGFGIYKLVGSFSRAGERGDAAVAVFHREYNAKAIAGLHAAAAPSFRSTVPLEKFTQLGSVLHERLGEWKSGERTGINLKNDNGHESLELTYSATFTKGSGTEEFVFDYNGDTPLLTGYHVKSPALLEEAEAEAQTKVAESKGTAP
jgi:hypothetical protein